MATSIKAAKSPNPDRVGAGRFFAWQSRGLSAAVNFIVLSYLMIYATDTLNMPAALVGTLLMVSRLIDAATDLFIGLVVDKTKTRLGKGRPYEFFILVAWAATWLLFSTPGDASLVVQSIWIMSMFFLVQSISISFLMAGQTPYMVRAFSTQGQLRKIASFGGLVIMLGSIAVNIAFPILMGTLATSPEGWSRLVLIVAVPMALIGMLRFIFVKETLEVETQRERPRLKDVRVLVKNNPYFLMVAIMWLGFSFVNGMGINQFFFAWVTGDIANMATANMMAIVVLPLLFFFPTILRKVPMGKMIIIGSLFYILSGIVIFLAGANMSIIMIGFVLTGIAALPMSYLRDLLQLDCGSYNSYKGHQRMDGTIATFTHFAGKLGTSLGTGALGFMLAISGYNGSLEVQPDSAIFMIRAVNGFTPVILFVGIAIMFLFYRIDKMMPEINAAKEAAMKEAAKGSGESQNESD